MSGSPAPMPANIRHLAAFCECLLMELWVRHMPITIASSTQQNRCSFGSCFNADASLMSGGQLALPAALQAVAVRLLVAEDEL